MLTHVSIHNFAIIDSVELELHSGMTALTGETGAGKSILIDALSLAMGDRAGKEVVRTGAKRAEIGLTLDIRALPSIHHWLTELELDNPDHPYECLLRRTVNADGGSKAYINSRAVPLQQLRELTSQLVDIHGQHAHHLLLKADTHRILLDIFAKNKPLCFEVKTHYSAWKKATAALNKIIQTQLDAQNQLALLTFQLQELDELAPESNEWQKLGAEHQRLSHAESLISECEQVINTLETNTLEKSVLALQKLSHTDKNLNESAQLLQSALIQIQEAHSELRAYTHQLELNPERLQEIDARLSKMHALARKHRIEPDDLPILHEKLQAQLQNTQNPELVIAQLEQEIAQHKQNYKSACEKLSKHRTQAAKKLNQAITQHMQTLGMIGGYFEIELTPHTEFSEFGQESIVFKVCTNKGHNAYPLHKIASGGELSRISLAIQVTTMQANDTIPIIVFDEVDVGIGGATAEIVGKLLKQLGKNAQVLCVTHLAQVASCADNHLFITKSTEDNMTRTHITPLDKSARVNEIARMLGGVTVTQHTLAHAKEMLEEAEF
ncbi:MAG: DNA repair protein RecN [Taibaiella sp.]|jgi:DNA repair protein RecN (Recombination protein N)